MVCRALHSCLEPKCCVMIAIREVTTSLLLLLAALQEECLCLQIHSPRTTVEEALQFSANLRFNQHPGKAAIHAFVEEVMDLMELRPIRHALVSV